MPISSSQKSISETYDALQKSSVLFQLLNSTAFLLTGEDRKGWLQGQITQDLRDLPVGGHVSACFCSPTGQLTAIAEIYDGSAGLILITDQPEIIEERFENFVILEEVTLEKLAQGIHTLQGVHATKTLSQSINLPPTDVYQDEDWLVVRHDRNGTGGWDIIKAPENFINCEFGIPEALDLAGLEVGVPIFGIDTTSKTLPPELGKAFESKSISYKKGCYQGQEVLHRIHARGHTNKTWVGFLCDAPVKVGDSITFRSQVVGHVTRVGFTSNSKNIAAGTIKNTAAREGTIVAIGEVNAEVVEMPILSAD